MKVKGSMVVILLLVYFLAACSNASHKDGNSGSFSLDSVSSYDRKYTANIEENDLMIVIRISDIQGNDVFSFEPVRKTDFWGICWELDTYNIWIQSGDIGVVCYKYEEGIWRIDPSAKRPDYIQSKYDKQ